MSAGLFTSLDVATKVLTFLDVGSICRFARVCKLARECARDDVVWSSVLPRVPGVTGTFDSCDISMRECAEVWTRGLFAKSQRVDASPLWHSAVEYAKGNAGSKLWRHHPGGIVTADLLKVTSLLVPYPIIASYQRPNSFGGGSYSLYAVDLEKSRMTTIGCNLFDDSSWSGFSRVTEPSSPLSPGGGESPVFEDGDGAFLSDDDTEPPVAHPAGIPFDAKLRSDVDAAIHGRLLRLVRARALHGKVLAIALSDLLNLTRPPTTQRDTILTRNDSVTQFRPTDDNEVTLEWLAGLRNTRRDSEHFLASSFEPPACAVEESPGCYLAHGVVVESYTMEWGTGRSTSVFLATLAVTLEGFTLSLRLVAREGVRGLMYS